jgi:hypothetical protein
VAGSIGGLRIARNDGARYAVPTAVNGGSKPSIFVPVTAHSHDLLGLHSLEAQSVRNADHCLGTYCVDLVTTIRNDIADLSRVERICHAKGVRPARNGAPARSGA